MPPRHYYTSITNNYLPKARVLANSIREHDPQCVLHLVLCDLPLKDFDLETEPFDHLHLITELEIPEVTSWIFRHALVELCTAAKGPALWKILQEYDAEQVYYFDPDIVVLGDLASLHRQLGNASVVLTPHQVAPADNADDVRINEITCLRFGVYNLGFLGVRRCPSGLEFARWWRDRLLTWCRADIPNGLFTDQRWCDLAPAYFDDVRILRDKEYNIATWNLNHRAVTLGATGQLLVDGKPVVFFHFSGFDSGAQLMMLRHFAPSDSPLFALRDWYLGALADSGQAKLGKTECAYARYSNGVKIRDTHRRIYRDRPDLIRRFPSPSEADDDDSFYNWVHRRLMGMTVAIEHFKTWIRSPQGRMITTPIKQTAAPIKEAAKRVPRILTKLKWRLHL